MYLHSIACQSLYNFMLPSRDGTLPLAGMTVFSTRFGVKPLVSLSSPGTHAARDRSMADGTMPSIHGKEQGCGLLRLLFQMDDDEI